jgi:hypothetical protein
MRPTRAVLCFAAFLAALAFAVKAGFAADEHHGEHYDKCAKACSDCQRACDSCASHCGKILTEGKKDHHKSLQTCQDCATHCSAAASIVSRKGPFADLICKACVEACSRCAEECEKFAEDLHMKKCAEECRKCEKACREMLKHTDTRTSEKTERKRERR